MVDGCPACLTRNNPVASRLVKRALDLGWRPTTAPAPIDRFGTQPLPLTE